MNILILAAGQVNFDTDSSYPLCLTEINGVPLIERQIELCRSVGDVNYIVALRDEDIRRYHLDNIVNLLAPNACIIKINENTRGAACTALLAAGYIDNEEELLILNGNELLDINFSHVLQNFRARELAAGTVIFSSIHPRYSYVRLNADNLVVEAAEKNPISRNATAGFYWFARGMDFVRAVKNMIRKDASINDLFYICPSLNELVLEQAPIGVYPIKTHQYHPFKTERQLTQYEAATDKRKFIYETCQTE